ncbi:MAG: hypothetical protein FK731_07590 [Asgard group archaeon]|nr:hypothetical protein [Asgard group archaeon]
MFEEEKKYYADLISENIVDFENEGAYKELILRERKIPLITKEESQKYGHFKLEYQESEGFYVETILIEKCINEILLYQDKKEWIETLSHTIFSYEKELDHGKEYVFKNAPLVRIMYCDIEREIFFIEDVDGGLYCSPDKIHWYIYLVKPEKRPYYSREKFLRKFRIPNI